MIDGLALGKTVLNMFSYTGAFSVAAAMGGALETTSVDLAKRQFEKNTGTIRSEWTRCCGTKDHCYGRI